MAKETEIIERLTGVPKAKVGEKVAQYKAMKRYISHKEIKEDEQGEFWTIEVRLKPRS